jgi:hypothetical protein
VKHPPPHKREYEWRQPWGEAHMETNHPLDGGKMDVKYINPFVKAVKKLFNTMIDVPFKLGTPNLKKGDTPDHEISSIIGLSGTVRYSASLIWIAPLTDLMRSNHWERSN